MNELRIYFVDLIAFVEDADGSYWVLLPDARQPSTASDGMTPIAPHYPVVLFDLLDPTGSDWPAIHQLLRLEDPVGRHLAWRLDRQELQILIPDALPVRTPGTASSTGLPGADASSFTWVPDLATLGLPSTVDGTCLTPAGHDPAGHTPSAAISARLQLKSGVLGTFQFVKRSEPDPPRRVRIPKLEFRELGGTTTFGSSRACADVVVAVIPFATPTVQIASVDLDSGSLKRSIQLTPTPEPLTNINVVNILVGNLSPDVPGPLPPFGVHFERYYDLVPQTVDRPIPQLVPGFPTDPSTHTSSTGPDGNIPSFIKTALQVDFSGFNGPICSVVKLNS